MNIIKIVNQDRENGKTKDSIKYNKDCNDFQCLEDGTIIGECRYCNLSLHCRQVDIGMNAKAIPMEAHYLTIIAADGEEFHELFCTGLYDLRSLNDRVEDDKVS
jgi:hypothetical protein